MPEEQILQALNAHWHASAAGDLDAEHDIYEDDAICDYPQSGERILGVGDLWISEIHNRLPRAPSIHSEHHGFPRREGRTRDTVFRRAVRSASLEEQMGPENRLTWRRKRLKPRGHFDA
jgi:hypothetical protein